MKPDDSDKSALAQQLDQVFTRPSGRSTNELREVSFEPGIAPHANGSVLCSFGNTQVICTAMIEDRIPGWMRQQKIAGGWLTAEYNMLPYSTLTRKDRPSSKGSRTAETLKFKD